MITDRPVFGDPLASPEDVVTAVLQTPFSDVTEISTFIAERQAAHGASEILQFG
jgi:hypothetical protein